MKKLFVAISLLFALFSMRFEAGAMTCNDGDLLLVFRQTGYNDVEFNLGSVTNYLKLTNGATLTVTNWDLNLVLSNNYNSLSGVKFILLAETDAYLPSSGKNATWMTDASASDTPMCVPGSKLTVQISTISSIISDAAIYTGLSSLQSLAVPSDNSVSYTHHANGGGLTDVTTLGGAASFTVEQDIPGTSRFFQIKSSTTPKAAQQIGSFSMSAGGVLTFTAGGPATPTILANPSSQTNVYGTTATFSISADGSAPLSYQWQHNSTPLNDGGNIAGASTANLTVLSVAGTDAGSYSVTVTNSHGTASAAAVLTVLDPAFTSQPSSQTVTSGSTATFSATAVGSGQLTYQWKRGLITLTDGARISGAASSSLTIQNVSIPDAGTYSLIVSNANGAVSSATATLTLGAPVAPPAITTQPLNQTNTVGGSAVLTVAASGGAPLAYQWRKGTNGLVDGGNISGAATSSLTLNNLSLADAGTYSVVVSNQGGSTNSANAVLQVVGSRPLITAQPQSKLLQPQGTNVTFSVTATGSAPFFYQWRRWNTNIAGATDSSYTLVAQPIGGRSSQSYSVIVSNAFGSVASATASLTIALDSAPPAITIIAPAANLRTNALTLSGVVQDKTRVTRVAYWLTNLTSGAVNSGDAAFTGGSNTWKSWSIPVTPAAGSNVLAVQGYDLAGNHSALITRSFFYIVQSPFGLSVDGDGKGTVAGVASILKDIAPTNSALLNVGEGYAITATPGANSFFSNWSGTITSTNKTLSFVMRPGMSLRANFVTNRFIAMAGTYNGLFYETNNIDLNRAGLLKGLTLGRTGSYSATLVLAGVSHPLSGSFDLAGQASASFARKGLPALTIKMQLDWSAGQINGTVSDAASSWSAPLLADKAAVSTNKFQSTLLIPAGDTAPGASAGGDSYALVSAAKGTISFSGKLSDGTILTPTAAISDNGDAPVYVSLYRNTGLLIGWLHFSNNAPAGTLAWLKGASKGLYPQGFTNLVSISGSAYTSPKRGERAISLASGTLEFSGGNLAAPLTFNVALSTNNVIVKQSGGATNFLTGAINPKTGLLTVSFRPTGGATLTATGVVLQNATNAAGFFVGKSQSGWVSLH